MSELTATSKAFLNHLKEASDAHQQLLFCGNYYNYHTSDGCIVANSPENHPKNKDNPWGLPYDHNLITSIQEYINASPMHFEKHSYIAAQGPRVNTFSPFWRMVASEKSSLIISVTNEREDDLKKFPFPGFKFDRFWPDIGTVAYGDVHVMLHEEQLLQAWDDGREEKIRLRRYLLKVDGFHNTVTHLHMENWPDNGIIHPESLMQLSRYADQSFNGGPIIVHCAAGVGRTGTFIAFHSLYHDIMSQKSTNQEISINIPDRIKKMRELRWGAMISDVTQYKLVIDALKLSFDH